MLEVFKHGANHMEEGWACINYLIKYQRLQQMRKNNYSTPFEMCTSHFTFQYLLGIDAALVVDGSFYCGNFPCPSPSLSRQLLK
jgi:hypothetical protein